MRVPGVGAPLAGQERGATALQAWDNIAAMARRTWRNDVLREGVRNA